MDYIFVGTNQSPIKIDTGELNKEFWVKITTNWENINNATIYQGDATNPDLLEVFHTDGTVHFENDNDEDETFNLTQFKFHSPAEHLIDNNTYDLELQFAHSMMKDGRMHHLNIAILYELDMNAENDTFISKMNLTDIVGINKTVYGVDMSKMSDWVNKKKKYYYKGSMTIQPCTESVDWFMLEILRRLTHCNSHNSQLSGQEMLHILLVIQVTQEICRLETEDKST